MFGRPLVQFKMYLRERTEQVFAKQNGMGELEEDHWGGHDSLSLMDLTIFYILQDFYAAFD